MIVCIDTNTVIQALAQHHPFHPILDTWVAGRLTWAVSTPILLEYEEVLTRLSGPARWRKLARLMDLAELTSGNLLRVTPSFQFRVVTADPDDNIFTDCAITADADYLLTEDGHFASLVGAGYKPRPISPQEFQARIIAAGAAKGL
jgi:putative PIN family toxin of toxin-antitoxin system